MKRDRSRLARILFIRRHENLVSCHVDSLYSLNKELQGQLVAGQEDIRAADLSECWTGVALDQNGHLLPRTCEAAAERDLWTLFQAWKGKSANNFSVFSRNKRCSPCSE